MRVLVCGSRDWTDRKRIEGVIMLEAVARDCVDSRCDLQAHVMLIVGYDPERCYPPGADRIAYMWAEEYGVEAKCFPYLRQYGKRGGFIRNQQMLDEGKPDLVLAFWKNKSRGTEDMIRRARKAGVEVRVIEG